jgi:hypothetical protein
VFSNGTASIPYSVATSVSWLKAVAATGHTQDNVTVSLNLSSLPACPGPASCSDTATVTITPLGSSVTAPSPVNVTVTLTIIPLQPQLTVSPQYLTYTSVAGSSSFQEQVQVSNTGGGTLNYSVTAPSVPWLTISCGASGPVTLSTPASICLTLNPAAAQVGLFHEPVTVNAGTQSYTVNVTLQVTPASAYILLSPDVMTFTAVSGGQAPASQRLNIFNSGTGQINWTAQSSTAPWLQLSTTDCTGAGATISGMAMSGGFSEAGSAIVCVDPAQVPNQNGNNYGQIVVTAPDGSAANSPQVITVVLKVLSAGSQLPEVALPTGVTLQATAGSSTLQSTPVDCTNPCGFRRRK